MPGLEQCPRYDSLHERVMRSTQEQRIVLHVMIVKGGAQCWASPSELWKANSSTSESRKRVIEEAVIRKLYEYSDLDTFYYRLRTFFH